VHSDRCRVHYEVTRVTQRLVEGMVLYIVSVEEIDDEDDDLLQVGMCILTRIYMFLGPYAIVQFVTLMVHNTYTPPLSNSSQIGCGKKKNRIPPKCS
jgi:hypothetical protein